MYMPAPTTISETTAKQYLKSEACRNLLPKLNGVLHCPLLVEKDGRLHGVEQGYDEITGFFVATAQRPETIELQKAVELLSGLLNRFRFRDARRSFSRDRLPVDASVEAGWGLLRGRCRWMSPRPTPANPGKRIGRGWWRPFTIRSRPW